MKQETTDHLGGSYQTFLKNKINHYIENVFLLSKNG